MKEQLVIKKLRYKDIFQDFYLTIYTNTINFLSGPNSCGKTTLCRILNKEIKNYTGFINDLDNIGLISDKIEFVSDNIEDEILFVCDNNAVKARTRKEKVNSLCKKYSLNKHQQLKDITFLEQLKVLIALEEVKKTKVLLMDNILEKLTPEEVKELMTLLKKTKKDITIIISVHNLDYVLYGDYLHIINDKQIMFSDEVLKVLRNDSKLNKIGLKLPFIADLSLKLKYYDLTPGIETSMNRLVRELWK